MIAKLNSFLMVVLAVIACIFCVIIFMTLFFILIRFIKGERVKKRKKKSEYKKRNFLLRLFIDFPNALSRDFFQRNPDAMKIHGVFIFAGSQGSGKTISAIQFIRKQLKKFPLIKIKSNIDINFQHGRINHWKDVVSSNNGEIGEIDFLDELQNWFSSNESSNFPPEMLTEITQQRKQHKVIVGTSQVFTRLSKPIREQTTYLCLPNTFFGCLTFVRVFEPEFNESGDLLKKRFVRMYFFVHDKELRECYDTYEKVERLRMTGFKPAFERSAVWDRNN